VAFVSGLLVLGVTAAAWTDRAQLSAAVGGSNTFDIGLVTDPEIDPNGVVTGGDVRQAEGDGIAFTLPGAATLVPGRSISREVAVFNNAPSLDAAVHIGFRQTSRAEPDITDHLTVTVTDKTTGDVLIQDRYVSDLMTDTDSDVSFTLSARGAHSPALRDDDPFSSGADGSAHRIDLQVHYAETAADGSGDTAALNGGRSFVRLQLDAESR
jgi:hypothetical protein